MKEIPVRFNIVFNSDWNNGNNSKLSSLERAEIHNLYLEYLHWDMKNKVKEVENRIEGGFSDFNDKDLQGFIQF